MKPAKDLVRTILDAPPDDATLEDIQYLIRVRRSVQQGLDAETTGRILTQEEVQTRMARWSKRQSDED